MTKERNPIALDFTDELLRYSWKEPFPSRKGVPEMYRFGGGYYSFDGQGQLVDCHYYIQDYQGNNRMVVNGHTNAIEQISHYYPYGALMGDISTQPEKQSFKYSGKELDRQFGLDLYDFHARQFDPLIPGFNGVDKYAEKYYWLSPYSYCAGNPVNCIDPDGNKLVILTSKEKQAELEQCFQKAYDYLKAHGASEVLDEIINADDYVVQLSWTAKDSYSSDSGDGIIRWNPYMACETNTGYVLSPAEILSHEADHARDSKTNPKHAENSKDGSDDQYDTKEERRVITGSEQRVAKKLGKYVPKEGTRTDHHGESVRVSDPTSSDIEEPQH